MILKLKTTLIIIFLSRAFAPVLSLSLKFNTARIKHSLVAMLLFLVGFNAEVMATVYYVDAAQSNNSGAGTSWGTAKRDVQNAIALANSGDEVWVKTGTYYPTEDPFANTSPTDARDKTFFIKDGVKLYGGFAGSETALSQRNIPNNQTILSGDIGTTSVSTDNCYHVIVASATSSGTGVTIDGFIIRDGRGDGSGSITVNSNTVNRNRAGIYLVTTASSSAIYYVTNNVILNNYGTQNGGGGYLNFGTNYFSNNIVADNDVGTGNGGGIAFGGGDMPVSVFNCLFYSNVCNGSGGAVQFSHTNITITNCSFSDNVASVGNGGGINFASSAATPEINNCIFYNNLKASSATSTGSDLYFNGGTSNTFNNCMLQLSSSGSYSGSFTSCIFGNADPVFTNSSSIGGSDSKYLTSDDGFGIQGSSPALNSGDNSSLGSISTDITGGSRTVSSTVDIGAYERSGASLSATQTQTNLSCNNVCTGVASVTASGGTSPYTYSWAPSGGTNASATGLCASSYTCTITDNASSSITKTFNITQPPAISVSTASQTNIACNGGSTGAATVTPSGGTPSYTYSWAPSGGTGATASSLTSGSYTVTVTDANSCQITRTFNITQPTALTTSATSQTNVACNGGSTGSATVTPSGGTPGYSYSWAPSGGTGATASSLTSGSYTVTVTDANSCQITRTFNITQPTALTTSATSQTNVACNGGSTGSATVTAGGGSPGYSYSWAPSGGTNTTASSLAAGTYTVTVTDANSCTATQTYTITQPTAISLTAASQTNVACNGGNTGAASVNAASGGAGSFTYDWTPGTPTGDGTTSITGLSAGTFTCTVTDANSCTATRTFTITQPTALSSSGSQTNVSCNGGSTGSATITPSGGTTSYSYSWAPSGGTSATASGLTSGTYTVTVTDANSCQITRTFNITQPTTLTASASSQTNVACNGGSTGSATVTAGGGTTTYSYSWSPSGGTGATASSLASGTYTVTVTDANSCTATQTFTITQPTALSLTSSSQTNIACNGGSTGAASVNNASGGAGGYTYDWTPGTPTGDGTTSITGLAAGTFTCTVTDANSCTATQTFTVTQPTAISLTIASQTNVACIGYSTGAASVNAASGGTGAFSYDWTPGSPTGDGTTSITGLSAGSYTCTATDANSCIATQTFTITQPTTEAEINVTGNSVTIVDGDATASGTDHTDFGNQNIVGGTMVRTFTVENTGTANLTISGVAISGAAASDYTVTSSPSSPVSASGSTTFQVTFDPSANGVRDAIITISSNDCDEGTYDFAITGTGSAQEINIRGNVVTIADGDATPSLSDHTSFGDLAPSVSLTRTYTIQNTGTARLDVSNIALSGTDASLFSLGGISLPDTITPGDSLTFTVTFTPTSGGVKTAIITITSNDADEASYDFAIQGERNCYTNSIIARPTNDGVNTGGVSTNIYLGYGAQKDTLKAIGFGTNMTWSPGTNLSCTTCTTTVFSPSAAGTYVFTASNGCISNSISICVASIGAGGSGSSTKVYLCHKEPVTNVTKTLAVLLRGIPSHFQYHPGDKLGNCGSGSGSGCTSSKKDFDYSNLVIDEQSLEVMCSPNPFRESFKLHYISNSEEEATVAIYGMTGNLVEKVTLEGVADEAELGSNLPNGIYTVSFIQGDKNRVFRMIKVD